MLGVACFHASTPTRRWVCPPVEANGRDRFSTLTGPKDAFHMVRNVEPWSFTQRDGSANNLKGKQNHEHQHPDRFGRPRSAAFWRWRWLLLEKSTLAMANGAHEVRLATEGHG